MTYTQVIAPNLNTVGNIGWCLAFVEKAYNDTNYSYATARDGWDACQFIHQDSGINSNLPTDVSVPVWFDYYESGVDYGHVAINVPGRGVLSSPYKADNTQQWFTGIDQCAKVLNCTYLGWSEDLMGVRVIGGTMDDSNNGIADANFVEDCSVGMLGRTSVGDVNLQNNVGRTMRDVVATFIRYPEHLALMERAKNGGAVTKDSAIAYIQGHLS